MAPSIVRIENKAATTFVGKFDMKRWEIAPGGAAFAPYLAAVTWLGNPGLIDREGRPDRTNEIDRIRTLYGHYRRPDITRTDFPALEVYDATNNRLPMLVDVVFGGDKPEHVNPVNAEDMLAEMQRQLEAMQALLRGRSESSQVAAVPGLDMPSDIPAADGAPSLTLDAGAVDGAPEDGPPQPADTPRVVRPTRK